jgi:VanZ family protein
LGLFDLQFASTNAGDVQANVLAYALLGVILGWYLNNRRWPTAVMITVATLGSAGLSLTLESFQTVLPNRVGSWTDMLLNAVGALVGSTAVVALSPLSRAVVHRVHGVIRERPMHFVATVLTLGLLLYNLVPFDFVTSTRELHASFARARWTLLAQSLSLDSGAAAAVVAARIGGALWFAVLGYMLALAGFESRRHPLAVLVSAIKNATLVAILVSGMQLFTESHVFDLGTLFLRTIGVLLGAWAGVFLVEHAPGRGGLPDFAGIAPASILVLLAALQIALIIVPSLVVADTSGDPRAMTLPLEWLWRLPPDAAMARLLSTFVTFGVFTWTVTALTHRMGLGNPAFPVGLALAVAVAATLSAARGVSPSAWDTPLLALLVACAIVQMDRLVFAEALSKE